MVTALRVDGVDISHHQSRAIDLPRAKKNGLKWLYHKATEGTSFKDANYSKRRAEAKAAGLPFGAYHFARADVGDAAQEANFFLAYAKPLPGDLRPALDLETTEGMSLSQIRTWAKTFIAVVEKAVGVKPVVYTPFDLGTVDDGCIIWRPRYNNSNTPPVLKWDIWQFSNGVYGVPKSIAGLGNVDLNIMRNGLTVSDMSIPSKRLTVTQLAKQVIAGKWGSGAVRKKRLEAAGYNYRQVQDKVNSLLAKSPEPPKPPIVNKKVAKLRFAHLSLQFSDTDKQRAFDINLLFSRKYDVITGTEAGHTVSTTNEYLKAAANKYGYVLSWHRGYDTWVAVKKTIVFRNWRTGAEHALDRSSKTKPTPPGRWGDKGVVWATWDMGPTFGEFGVASVHNLTWGGAGTALKNSSDIKYAEVMNKWVLSQPAAQSTFIGGDFNRNDKTGDVFRGKVAARTCWDDLKVWPNTGHGPIDAIARMTADSRVRCVAARVLDDGDLFFYGDHFLVEAEYEVRAI